MKNKINQLIFFVYLYQGWKRFVLSRSFVRYIFAAFNYITPVSVLSICSSKIKTNSITSSPPDLSRSDCVFHLSMTRIISSFCHINQCNLPGPLSEWDRLSFFSSARVIMQIESWPSLWHSTTKEISPPRSPWSSILDLTSLSTKTANTLDGLF